MFSFVFLRIRPLLPRLVGLVWLWTASAFATEVATTTSTSAELNTAAPCTTTCAPFPTDRPQDQVWLLSTRHLHCSAASHDMPAWQVSQWQDKCWTVGNSESLFAANGQMRTVVYVHGNRVDSSFAVEGGLRAYRQLVACASEEPVRFIIWSWCSDRLHGKRPVKDARIKANEADGEGALFGRFLTKFTPEDRVGLVGFSYGARIITGGLHLVGGGQWMGCRMPMTDTPAQFRAVLWAAAENNDWLLPGHAHGCAIQACPVWLNIINNCDSALRFYPRVDRCSSQEALGYRGVAGRGTILNQGVSFRECTVQHWVGSEHTSLVYLASAGVIRETRLVVLAD